MTRRWWKSGHVIVIVAVIVGSRVVVDIEGLPEVHVHEGIDTDGAKAITTASLIVVRFGFDSGYTINTTLS